MKTQAAKAAAAIRKELKTAFPKIVFSVTSDTYSMGDSVRIKYEDGPKTEEVDKITSKYQYGNFDGMTDCYNNDNCRDDIPQAKYVQISRSMSERSRNLAKELLKQHFDIIDDKSCFDRLHCWYDNACWRLFNGTL